MQLSLILVVNFHYTGCSFPLYWLQFSMLYANGEHMLAKRGRISKIESAWQNPTQETLKRLADEHGITPKCTGSTPPRQIQYLLCCF